MSDRIVELLRQKQLLQEHLNWLDQEIARAASSTDAAPPVSTPAPATSIAPVLPVLNPAASAHDTVVPAPAPSPSQETAGSDSTAEAMRKADEIIARYKQEEALQPEDTKRGCLVLAAAVFALMGIAVLGSYWFFYR